MGRMPRDPSESSPEPRAMDWDKLRIFHTVAEAGSFTHAGDWLHLSQSAISRQISTLEEALGITLFHRHARGLILTEQGEVLFRTTREIFTKLSLTQSFLKEKRDRAAGQFTITTTTGFAFGWLAPRLQPFLDRYPEMQVRIIADDLDLDLRMREADVAIRLHSSPQPDLLQHLLATFPVNLYAGRDYLERHGHPQSFSDLAAHRLLGFSGQYKPLPQINWMLDRLFREKTLSPTEYVPRLSLNNIPALAHAAACGNGIAALPSYAATQDSRLIQVLPGLSVPQAEAFLTYPAELRSSKRLMVFRKYLSEILSSQASPLDH